MRRFAAAASIFLALLPFMPAQAARASLASGPAQGMTTIQMAAGETKHIVLRYRNLGSSIWKNSGRGYVSLYATHRYGRKSVFYGPGWKSRIQPASLSENSVKPGSTGSFEVALTAPDNPDVYQEQFQLASEKNGWIWGSTVRLTINVSEPQTTSTTPIRAKAYVVLDAETGQVIDATNSDQVRSIASITKLMTTLVLNDRGLDPNTVVTMQRGDEVGGGRLRVRYGTQVTVQDLFASMLVSSANNAANALARTTGLPRDAFVDKMNEKAREIGMTRSAFVDPTGIEAGNVSTAKEVALMARAAFGIPSVADVMSQPVYHVVTVGGRRDHQIKNTNKLLSDSDIEVAAGKTGFTYEAGYTFVARVRKPGERDLIVAVLGCDTKNQPFRDTKALALRAWTK